MPLVFVHGVNNRMHPGYQEGVAARDALFRRFALASIVEAPDFVTILNPYWGGLGANPRWGLACLPGEGDVESLGPAKSDPQMEPLAAAAAEHAGADAPPEAVLLAAAHCDFPATVSLIFAAGAVEIGVNDAAAFAELAARAAVYTDANPEAPDWLTEIGTDDDLLGRLRDEIAAMAPANDVTSGAGATASDGWEALGIRDGWGAIQAAADRLRVAAGDALGTKTYGLIRRYVAPTLATFLGDVFEYLAHRGTPEEPGPIAKLVIDSLCDAQEAVSE